MATNSSFLNVRFSISDLGFFVGVQTPYLKSNSKRIYLILFFAFIVFIPAEKMATNSSFLISDFRFSI